MRTWRVALGAAIVLVAANGPFAALAQEGTTCFEANPGIQACTFVIEAGWGPPRLIAGAHFNRGVAYQRTGAHQQALADYDQAIALDPTSVDAYRVRGRLRNSMGDYQGAIADANAGARLEPDDWQPPSDLGDALYALGNYREAIDAYSRSISLDANQGWNYEYRGRAHAALSQFSQAVADFDQATRLGRASTGLTQARNDAARQIEEADAEQRQASSSESGANDQCSTTAFDAWFRQFSGTENPIRQTWGARDNFQYAYFIGTRGLQALEQHRSCMSEADYSGRHARLEGMRDQGLTGCRQLSTNEASCVPEYPQS